MVKCMPANPAKRLAGVILPPGVEPEFISVNQACIVTNFGRSKLYELMADGTLESVVVAGRRLVRLRSARSLGSAVV